jgi:hypothetical protein
MTDTERRLDDIEKRLARLERAAEEPIEVPGAQAVWNHPRFSTGLNGGKQWCQCGRDICRAPDCPSHRTDPLGR